MNLNHQFVTETIHTDKSTQIKAKTKSNNFINTNLIVLNAHLCGEDYDLSVCCADTVYV